MKEFKRGDVFNVYVPEMKGSVQSPPPSFVLHGNHSFVVLSDSNDRALPPKSIMAIPITSADTAVNSGKMKPSYVPIDKSTHPFLDHDSYISTHQAMPLSRHWLGEVPIGKIDPSKMVEVDLQMVRTCGLQETVQKLISTQVNKQLESFERSMAESAPTRQKGMER
ncbi:MAG: type II toxin-antitoxin system PemK/MazF family toxin [Bacillota bacterium]